MGRRIKKKVNLWQQLTAYNDKYKNDDVVLGKEMLGFPRKTDSAREIMYIHHLDQRVNVKNVEKPRIYTGYEDMVGDNSSYIHRVKKDCEIDKILYKFVNEDGTPRPPMLVFLHYLDDDSYDVEEINPVEDMAEKYGFSYDNSKALQLKEGQVMNKGDIINAPFCHDAFGNYGFGKNYTVMLQISDNIIEDGIEVSDEVASDVTSDKFFGSDEVYTVKVSLNDNAILINTYGDENTWKCFPDIGEHTVGNQVCTQRTINKSQILFDMKSSNTRRRLSSDAPAFISGEVVDISVYCNKTRDEIPNTTFNEQILKYYDIMYEYNKKIYEYTKELIDSGCKVSQNIKIINKDVHDYIDDDVKYKDDNDRVFSYMEIYFTIKKEIGVSKGQKITGRHGNKGVVAKITKKELMPHLETGKPVDIILEALGPVNRLNVMQLYEISINFVSNRNIEHMKEIDDVKEKERILFRMLEIFGHGQREAVETNYKSTCKTKAQKEEYFRIVEKYGIFINVPPYWSDINLYEALQTCYKEFPWIQPYKVFFYDETSKRWVKMMNDQIIAEMYFVKLKQSSKKGLSARSTGSVNRKWVPDKTDSAKRFQTPYSNIPVRRGKQEMENDMISVDPEKIAVEQLAYRSSPIARRTFATKVMENYLGVDTFEPDDTMTNVNVQILSAYLLIMGVELLFEHDELNFTDTPGLKNHIYKGRKYYCSSDDMKTIVANDIANARILDKKPGAIYFGPNTSFDEFADELANEIRDSIMDYI